MCQKKLISRAFLFRLLFLLMLFDCLILNLATKKRSREQSRVQELEYTGSHIGFSLKLKQFVRLGVCKKRPLIFSLLLLHLFEDTYTKETAGMVLAMILKLHLLNHASFIFFYQRR